MELVERPLGQGETLMQIVHRELCGAFAVVTAVAKVRGPLTREFAGLACTPLLERHPLLSARIEARGDAFYYRWAVEARAVPLTEVSFSGVDEACRLIGQEADRPLDVEQCLWRVLLLRDSSDDASTYLALSTHHAISDGTSAAYLIHELLGYAAKARAGEVIEVEPLPARPAVDALLAPASSVPTPPGQSISTSAADPGEARHARAFVPFAHAKPVGERQTRLVMADIEAPKLHALHERCRLEKTTIHAALAAALLLAIEKQFDERVRIGIDTPVNLRKQCVVEVGPSELGCYASDVSIEYDDLRERTGFWDLARDYRARLGEAMSAGTPLGLGGHADPAWAVRTLRTMPVMRLSLCLTNVGQIECSPTPPFGIESICFLSGRQAADQILFVSVTTVHHSAHLVFAYTSPLVEDAWVNTCVADFWGFLDGAVAEPR